MTRDRDSITPAPPSPHRSRHSSSSGNSSDSDIKRLLLAMAASAVLGSGGGALGGSAIAGAEISAQLDSVQRELHEHKERGGHPQIERDLADLREFAASQASIVSERSIAAMAEHGRFKDDISALKDEIRALRAGRRWNP